MTAPVCPNDPDHSIYYRVVTADYYKVLGVAPDGSFIIEPNICNDATIDDSIHCPECGEDIHPSEYDASPALLITYPR